MCEGLINAVNVPYGAVGKRQNLVHLKVTVGTVYFQPGQVFYLAPF